MSEPCSTCGKPSKIARFGKRFCSPHCAAVYEPARSEDGLVLERLPSGEFAWLRPPA